jgi:CRP/FNR family cyclic AMP-dependent transcriptional regulator
MRKSLMMMGILEDSDVEWLVATGEQQYITAGTVLIQEGKPIDALYILLDGRLAVSVGYVTQEPIAVLLSGEVVGEISFVDSRPPLASVSAIEDSHVLAIWRVKLLAKIDCDPSFAARFYKSLAAFLADRLRSVTGRIGDRGQSQADAADELNDDIMDHVSLAAVRFDNMLKRLRSN